MGQGDDCALLEVPEGHTLAVTTDTLNEGIHFFKDMDPYLLGRRCLQVNLSDLSAMGAAPLAFTLSLTLPGAEVSFLEPFSKGLLALAGEYSIPLIGGNTARGPLSITISCYGTLEKGRGLFRDRAQTGDLIFVTGTLGSAGLYVKQGYDTPYPELIKKSEQYRALEREVMTAPCRCAFAQAITEVCDCAIDISDGVVGDLRHILERSHKGARLYLERLPRGQALSALPLDESIELAAFGGGDYELLLCIESEAGMIWRAMQLAEEYQVTLTEVGEITENGYLTCKHGKIAHLQNRPFEHFAPD